MKIKHQEGFGYIAAIVIVVVLALLGVAATRLVTTQQTSASQDLLSSRAWQAARAGTEWGMYRALRANSCGGPSKTLAMENGFSVTVKCEEFAFKEGESAPGIAQHKKIYTVTAVACNAATCPSTDNATVASLEYTERSRVITTCSLANGPGVGQGTGAPC
jgi:MSHA biogenesis protein MshP